MNLKPLHDNVLIQREESEERTASGIIIPDSAKERPQRGTVLAVGPGKGEAAMNLKKGDTVLFAKYAGTEFKVDGLELVIMRQDDVIAIVE
ncbi:chaperonin GroES [Paucidesulfovibrio gracilis DSM 16080]|uniref:Co-chaperonin GroES n=1 Tax=Paucidesulfovibrio gracilis DSM 16080 TaxID=1121449 RepID=A0A1T4X4C2_9BACT|nr:co-chaperone GroES [Paucidesulfovibrio gracilis]SKA83701.1 chaperonin GroES [Paucidesulfovibrio gracilis DSM 16080]